MGDPNIEVKTEDGPVAKKIKIEVPSEDVTSAPAEIKKEVISEGEAANGAVTSVPAEIKKEVLSEEEAANGAVTSVPAEKKKEVISEGEAANGAITNVKIEAKDIKKENGSEINVKKENGANEEQTAEERGDPDLETNLVYQIEYYFGNINLPRDKFLQEQIKLEDGWVPLDVMLRFQRLKALTKNPSTIVTCLKNSSTLMEVNEDGTKIRRSPNKPLPTMGEEWQKLCNERTVYCKGFPQDETEISTYLSFFKPYGPVEHIMLRKYKDRITKNLHFKGSLYVLFETKELADKFLALESVAYKGKELIRMTQAAHMEETKKERDERWGKKLKKDTDGGKDTEKPKVDFAKGCILHIEGFKNEDLTREIIKSSLTELGADVAYIQFNKGDKEALVRLKSTEEDAAVQFIKKMEEDNTKVKFDNEEVELKVLEGEDEEAFLQKTRETIGKQQKGQRGQKHHRGGRKGGFRGHKRGRSPTKGGPPAKQAAVSS